VQVGSFRIGKEKRRPLGSGVWGILLCRVTEAIPSPRLAGPGFKSCASFFYLKHPKLKAAAQQVGNPPGDHAPNLGGTGVLDDNCHVVRDSESQSAKGQFNQQLNDDDDHVGSVSSGNRIPRITIITMPLMPLQPQVTLRAGKI
jgi:hypothetical protein